MTQDKKAYIEFCRMEQNIPLFMKPEWLNAVVATSKDSHVRLFAKSEVDWDVTVSRDKKGQISSVLVYLIKKKWGFTFLTEPPLSPFCGIWIREKPVNTQYELNHYIKNEIENIIRLLPKCHFAHFRFSTQLTDWQPFYWAGFKQTTAYTYQLDLKQTQALTSQFKQNTQRNIAKAKKHFTIQTTLDFKHFLDVNRLVFERQSKKYPISETVWQNVEALLSRTHQRRMYFAQNTEGGIDAAIYIVYDNKTAYYLAGGSTDAGRQLGASHLLLAHAIIDAQSEQMDVFDFEGSMLKGVESFFRGFNGVLTPYFKVWKYQNKYLEWLDDLRKS